MCDIAAWELDECQVCNAVKDIPDGEFRRYGLMHFKTVSCIIQDKLNHISDPVEKRAYLDSLIMNYEDMRSDELADKVVTVVSGSGVGISILDLGFNEKTLAIMLFIVFVSQLFKIIPLHIRRYRFYLII